MSKQIEIAECKKRIADLIRQTNAVNAQKQELLLALQNLNISYQQGSIGYLEYSNRWSEVLANKTIEEYVDSYDRQIYELAAAKKPYLVKVRAIEREEKDKTRTINLAASIMIIIAVVAGLALSPFGGITGFAIANDTETTISNATISISIDIARSANLTAGITFGSVNISSNDNNATDNYNASDQTGYYILSTSDSTVPIDLCIKANNDLMNNTVALGIGNLTWSNATSTDIDTPAGPDGSALMTTSYVKGVTNISPTDSTYFRFWLDVPSDQAAGDYNNTIDFVAKQWTKACG